MIFKTVTPEQEKENERVRRALAGIEKSNEKLFALVENKYNIRSPAFIEILRLENTIRGYLRQPDAVGKKRDILMDSLDEVMRRKRNYEAAVFKNRNCR